MFNSQYTEINNSKIVNNDFEIAEVYNIGIVKIAERAI